MKRAIMAVSAAAAIALAPFCIPPAQAHADDPPWGCVSITDPAAHQACIDEYMRDIYRRELQPVRGEPQSRTDRPSLWVTSGGVRSLRPPIG